MITGGVTVCAAIFGTEFQQFGWDFSVVEMEHSYI